MAGLSVGFTSKFVGSLSFARPVTAAFMACGDSGATDAGVGQIGPYAGTGIAFVLLPDSLPYPWILRITYDPRNFKIADYGYFRF
jgi:hypothetical protein